MTDKIIISGFGGQGIMLAGKLLIQTGMGKDLNVTFIPSYGAEVRGGTAHCQIIVSEEEIASPMIIAPDMVMIMNNPSLIKFESKIKSGGLLLLNTSLVHSPVTRDDLKVVQVPATDIASELGVVKASNMVMLGALIKYNRLINLEDLIKTLPDFLPARHRDLLAINIEGLRKGFEYVS